MWPWVKQRSIVIASWCSSKTVGALPKDRKAGKGNRPSSGWKGLRLSSGERQLISFARTLYMNPKNLTWMKPTSRMDTGDRVFIQGATAVLQKGRTTFIIAHRLSTIRARGSDPGPIRRRYSERQHADHCPWRHLCPWSGARKRTKTCSLVVTAGDIG